MISEEDCTNQFSPQQAARMHCYIDLKYRGWLEGRQRDDHFDSVIPLPPRIISVSDGPKPSITMVCTMYVMCCAVQTADHLENAKRVAFC